MGSALLVLAVLVVAVFAYRRGIHRVRRSSATGRPHSLLSYYGYYAALCCIIPSLGVFLVWTLCEPFLIEYLILTDLGADHRHASDGLQSMMLDQIRDIAAGVVPVASADPALVAAAAHYNFLETIGSAGLIAVALAATAIGFGQAMKAMQPNFRARNRVEMVLRFGLLISSSMAILTTIGIVLSLIFESIRFFNLIPLGDFLFGLHWSPQIALRGDQVASGGSFGAIPLFTGTLLITMIAMLVATPIALMSAIYMSQYASARLRSVVKPALEILAGVPTVVYGFFAALTVAPLLREAGVSLGLDVASESALAAGLVMGIMIIPFISSLSDDVITAVPRALRDGSYALGATPSETMRMVIFPAALPGIVGAFLLAVSRAIGETMIVVMAAGLAANLTANPLEAVTTVTVQIVTLLVGDQEFDSAKTLAAFALGMVLFLVTLSLNAAALKIIQRYREKYD